MKSPPVPKDIPRNADTLAACVETFRRHMHLPDPGVIYATLAAIVANRMTGDPVWVLLVGPPSSGKTEALRAAHGETDCRFVGTISEAGLLSGTPKRQQDKSAKGGLLKEIGEFGILLLKDFTTVLSMSRDAKNALLAALREIADGSWTRTVGSDGGVSKTWEGKLGLVGGVTTAIDSAHAVMGMMGERFVFYRLTDQSSPQQASVALGRKTPVAVMRKELAAAVADVLARVHIPDKLPILTDDDQQWIAHLATLVAQMRSAVERDSYNRDIVLIHEPEAPARLAISLKQIFHAAQSIGLDESAARDLVWKMGLDSTPVIRRRVFGMVVASPGVTTQDIAENLSYPTSTTRRSLEDLAVHDLTLRQTGKGADKWSATARAIQLWERSSLGQKANENAEPNVPVLSVGHEREQPFGHPLISPFTMESNKTGKQEDDGLSYEEIERKAIQAECLESTGTDGR